MRVAVCVAFLALACVSIFATGCGSDPPTKEDTAKTREAICSGGGGGGGGDPCTSTTGYCPAECGYCFSSAKQRLELQNMWECTPGNGGGGGGGGGGGSCSADQAYGAHELYNMNPGDDPATVLAVLCDNARSRAEAACRNSGRICTAHVGASNQSAAACGSTGFCECDWTTNCTYSWY